MRIVGRKMRVSLGNGVGVWRALRCIRVAVAGVFVTLACFMGLSRQAVAAGGACTEICASIDVSARATSVYQYRVEVGTRQAYLWVPPHVRRVRGIFFAMENMLERQWLEALEIRQAAAEEGLAIVWLSRGGAGDAVDWQMGEAGVAAILRMLTDLSVVSAHAEIADAPLLVTGHSWNGRIAWTLTRKIPERVMAVLAIRTYPLPEDLGFRGIPFVYMVGQTTELPQYADGRPGDRDFYWPVVRKTALALRAADMQNLIGVVTVAGGTHTDWSTEQSQFVARFIHAAARARLPRYPPNGGPVPLTPVLATRGWLVDAVGMDPGPVRMAPYHRYAGDAKTAYWFFDAGLARAAVALSGSRAQLRKQMPSFVVDGTVLPVAADGYVHLPVDWSHGDSFAVAGGFLDAVPASLIGAGAPLGHGKGNIRFRATSGSVEQAGPNLFRVYIDRQQARDMLIEIEAESDGVYRRAVQPAKIALLCSDPTAMPQTIDFPAIADPPAGTTRVQLAARASSGLPVSYSVVYGPAWIDGDLLKIDQVPCCSASPIEIDVMATQIGRSGPGGFQSAPAVHRRFHVTRTPSSTEK